MWNIKLKFELIFNMFNWHEIGRVSASTVVGSPFPADVTAYRNIS